MATNSPSCFSIFFLEQLLKFLVNFTLLKYVKSQKSYGFLITKELIFGFQILDFKDHFSASLNLVFVLVIIANTPSALEKIICILCVLYVHAMCLMCLRFSVYFQIITGVPKRVQRLNNHETKGFCSIIKLFLISMENTLT